MGGLCELGVLSAAEKLSSGEISSVELTEACFERIEKTDGDIGAFLALDRDGALLSAEASDKRRRCGECRGIFDGIPYSLKDNISTKGIPTTCASRMLSGYVAPYDATVVGKLREGGAVLLGKNNMDEFAMGTEAIHSAHKLCKNPHDTTRIAGGSSGGSAAAVAADMALFSLGSDTGGSVRLPASHCGVVGFKPTYGTVSRYGLVSYASSLDTVGTLCKSTADTRAVFDLIRGRDRLDMTSIDLSRQGECVCLKGLFVALPKMLFSYKIQSVVRDAVELCARRIEEMGACVDEISMPSFSSAVAAYYVIAMSEASSNLARFDGIRFGHRSEAEAESISELISNSRGEGFGSEAKRRILAGTYFLSEGNYERYYLRAERVRARVRAEMGEIFDKYDAVLSPTALSVARKLDGCVSSTDTYREDALTVVANLTGAPAISVPFSHAKGMPIGIQFTAKHGREDVLFALSEAIERWV